MKIDEIKKRLLSLEDKVCPDHSLCIVRLPDGSKEKVPVIEWFDHRHEWEWMDSVKDTACAAPVYFILFTLTEKCIDDAIREGKKANDPEIVSMQDDLLLYRKAIIGE